jgi:hypothetical protein
MDKKTLGLSKLLYTDNAEDRQRNYLNINLLRYLKNFLLEAMTEKERGCINLYHLENYLIERALDPLTEEIYGSGDELINATLTYLRSKPFYWIINSEIYLEIIAKDYETSRFYHDDNYINKDLIAIYNYIYLGGIRVDRSGISGLPSTTDPDFEILNLFDKDTSFTKDPLYVEFIELLQSCDYINIDPSKKTIYDMSVIPCLYNYMLISKNNNINTTKLQNLLLWFSYVSYSIEIDALWAAVNTKTETENIFQNPNSKKYNLRLSKLNEQEMDEMYIQKQIKIFELQERIAALKGSERVKDFLIYLKTNKVITF